MELLLDASTILAVLLGEPEAQAVRKATIDSCLYVPACLEYEIGNALSALVKRGLLNLSQSIAVYRAFAKIPVCFISVEIEQSLMLSFSENLYAYDAYYLYCAKRLGVPLLTLDKKLAVAANNCSVKVCPVDGVDYL